MSDNPIRVQLSRAKGWRMPPNTVKVDRTTKWGNPHTGYETRAQAADAFRRWLNGEFADWLLPVARLRILREVQSLRGKNLACWCPPGEACHADVLLELANADARAMEGRDG